MNKCLQYRSPKHKQTSGAENKHRVWLSKIVSEYDQEYHIHKPQTKVKYVKCHFLSMSDRTLLTLKRQSRLQQTANFATYFLIFEKIRYDIS